MKTLTEGRRVVIDPCQKDIDFYGFNPAIPFQAVFLRDLAEEQEGANTVLVEDQEGNAWTLEKESLLLHDALFCHHHKHGVTYQPFRSYVEPDYGFWEHENLHEEDQAYYVELAQKLGLDLEFEKLEWVEIVRVDLTNIPTI